MDLLQKVDFVMRFERALLQELPFLLWTSSVASCIEDRLSWTYREGLGPFMHAVTRRMSYAHMLAHEDPGIRDSLTDKLASVTGLRVQDIDSVWRSCRCVTQHFQQSPLLRSMAGDSWQFLLAAWNPDFCHMDTWDLFNDDDTTELRTLLLQASCSMIS